MPEHHSNPLENPEQNSFKNTDAPKSKKGSELPTLENPENWVSVGMAAARLKLSEDDLNLFLLGYRTTDDSIYFVRAQNEKGRPENFIYKSLFEEIEKRVTKGEKPTPPLGWLTPEQMIGDMERNTGIRELSDTVILEILQIHYLKKEYLIREYWAVNHKEAKDKPTKLFLSPKLQQRVSEKIKEAHLAQEPFGSVALAEKQIDHFIYEIGSRWNLGDSAALEYFTMVSGIIRAKSHNTLVHIVDNKGALTSYIDKEKFNAWMEEYMEKHPDVVTAEYQKTFRTRFPLPPIEE